MAEQPTQEYRECLRWALDVAIEAGEILKASFGHVEAREKGPADLVTDADGASQAAIGASLARTFPGHTMLAEEEGGQPDPAKRWRWIVDPLDGTINFAHGLPLWCVSIALEHEGRLVVGVIHAPLLGETFSAMLGEGARRNGQPLHVSSAERLQASLITCGMPTNFAADADRQMACMRRFSTGTHSLRRTGSTAWNLAQLAAGACEVFYATSIHPWDVAAGVLLVREAGGQVSNLAGGPYNLYNPEILATNGRVHAESVRALAEAWPERDSRGA